MFTMEESALLGRMLRVVGLALLLVILGGSCYAGAHWLHRHRGMVAAPRSSNASAYTGSA
ncbi:MAG: hypothetical protein DMF84_11255 [Acidobacteria bacterium]|nr:MAG: hypothetical protein DMF84_11255 [Acidobacteriota bacterium]